MKRAQVVITPHVLAIKDGEQYYTAVIDVCNIPDDADENKAAKLVEQQLLYDCHEVVYLSFIK